MDLSIFVAQVAAIIYLSVGVGILVDKKYYSKVFDNMLKDTTAMYLGGFMALLVGFALVTFHNDWMKSWEVLVTVIGWMALVKGVMLIAFPRTFLGIVKPWIKSKNLSAMAVAVVVLGLIFGYFGFVA